jgi:hypothetical protein
MEGRKIEKSAGNAIDSFALLTGAPRKTFSFTFAG